MLAAYENFFSLFSFFVSSYVGYVPASDDFGYFLLCLAMLVFVEVFVRD